MPFELAKTEHFRKILSLSDPGFSTVPGQGGRGVGRGRAEGVGGGVGWKNPAAYNSKTIHGIEMKFGQLVENHKLINFV